MREAQLAGDLADLRFLDAGDGVVRRRHREQAVQEIPALLARRDLPEHLSAIEAQGIQPIDMIVVNLYPFRETAARRDVSPDSPLPARSV